MSSCGQTFVSPLENGPMWFASFQRWDEDGAVGVILMKGAGDKAFCAGGDVVGEWCEVQQFPCSFRPHECHIR